MENLSIHFIGLIGKEKYSYVLFLNNYKRNDQIRKVYSPKKDKKKIIAPKTTPLNQVKQADSFLFLF